MRVVGSLSVYEKDGKEWRRMKVWWGGKMRMEIGWSEGDEKEVWINGGGVRFEGGVVKKGKVEKVEEKDMIEF